MGLSRSAKATIVPRRRPGEREEMAAPLAGYEFVCGPFTGAVVWPRLRDSSMRNGHRRVFVVLTLTLPWMAQAICSPAFGFSETPPTSQPDAVSANRGQLRDDASLPVPGDLAPDV